MIKRKALLNHLHGSLERSRVVVLTGPRQCGKTTLAREIVKADSPNYFDLEDPVSLAMLDEPMTALQGLRGIVVIDEIQRRPDLFPVLRVLSDRLPLPAKFLILGSASREMLRQSSESLAGRIEIVEMSGFKLSEIGLENHRSHWLRGGLPLSFLAGSENDSLAWRKNFIQTFLERDMPQFGIGVPALTMFRFWTMLAHYHGQIWNAAEPARSLGISEPTVRRYLDILTGMFMIRQLAPWHANLKKRQVKAPKIYFCDTGILHQLLGIGSEADLLAHPKCGASWEGYVIEETINALEPDQAYYWATHNGAEIDLIIVKDGRMFGVECKRMDAPQITPSIKTALEDLNLEHIAVVYPGTRSFPLNDKVTAAPLKIAVKGLREIFMGK